MQSGAFFDSSSSSSLSDKYSAHSLSGPFEALTVRRQLAYAKLVHFQYMKGEDTLLVTMLKVDY